MKAYSSLFITFFLVFLFSHVSVIALISNEDISLNDLLERVDSDCRVESTGFDLASIITLAPGEDDRVYPGETVSFQVTVFNQGTISAENIEVTLMIPIGLTSVSGIPNLGTITFTGPIAPGDLSIQIIDFVVDSSLTSAAELIVRAEISSAEDEIGANPADMDSTPDADFTNDAGGVVDSNTDDTINNENGDEDDSDPENVFVEIFDLALRMNLAAGEDNRVYPGETVSFDVEIFNQGTVSAFNIVIEDYVPMGLTATGANVITIPGPLPPGASQTFNIEFTVDAAGNSATIVNRAEISGYMDDLGEEPDDLDSVADSDPTNDPTVDGEISNGGGDEDDSDTENVFVEIFDLALTKTTTNTDILKPGDDVTFTVTMINQGSVMATNIAVVDYLPDFFVLSGSDTNGWTTSGGTLSKTIFGPLFPGSSVAIDVVLTVQEGIMAGTVDNFAEIISAEDDFGESPDDIDSTPDADNNNDVLVDNEINNVGNDEDDHDIESVEVCIEVCGSDIVETINYPSGTVLVLESFTFISSIGIVEPGADVIYDGTDYVELLSGFETQNASEFEAIIEGCGGAVSANQVAENK